MPLGPSDSNMSSGKVTKPILSTYKCGFFIINYGINLFILGQGLFTNEYCKRVNNYMILKSVLTCA